MKRDHGILPRRVEGEREGDWILVDLLDAVVHVFTPEARDFYRLDRLWREAPAPGVRRGLLGAVRLPPSRRPCLYCRSAGD